MNSKSKHGNAYAKKHASAVLGILPGLGPKFITMTASLFFIHDQKGFKVISLLMFKQVNSLGLFKAENIKKLALTTFVIYFLKLYIKLWSVIFCFNTNY